MTEILTRDAEFICDHGRIFRIIPNGESTVRVASTPVLTLTDLQHAVISGTCQQPVDPNRGISPCITIQSVMDGVASDFLDGEVALVTSDACGFTDGMPACRWSVHSSGQTKQLILDEQTGHAESEEQDTSAGEIYQRTGANKSWIGLNVTDQDGKPLANEWFRITRPYGTIADGKLDEKGAGRLDNLDQGVCSVVLPDLLCIHRVRQGETLSSIARQYYGKPDWQRIWRHACNAEFRHQRNSNPNVIHPGDLVYVPSVNLGDWSTGRTYAFSVTRDQATSVEIDIDPFDSFHDNEGNRIRRAKRNHWYLAEKPRLSFEIASGGKHELIPVNPNETYNKLMTQCEAVRDEQLAIATRLRGNMKYWFVRVYYWVTAIEIDCIKRGDYQYPHIKMQEVIAFHITYRMNLDHWENHQKIAVESNWRIAFTAADKMQSLHTVYLPRSWEIKKALLPAFEAHIRFDLPRAIASVYHRFYEWIPGAELRDFRRDFDLMSSVFDKAQSKMQEELDRESWPVVDPGWYETLRNWGFPFFFSVDRNRRHTWEKVETICDDWSRSLPEVQRDLVYSQAHVREPLRETFEVDGDVVSDYDWLNQPDYSGLSQFASGASETSKKKSRIPVDRFRLVRTQGGYDQTIDFGHVESTDHLVLFFRDLLPSGNYSLFHLLNSSQTSDVIFSGRAYATLNRSKREKSGSGKSISSHSKKIVSGTPAEKGDKRVEIKVRLFIPSPVVAVDMSIPGTAAAFGGDNRSYSYDQGTARAELTAMVTLRQYGDPRIVLIGRHWGESTEYSMNQLESVAGKPFWWKAKSPTAVPVDRLTLEATNDNLDISIGGSLQDNIEVAMTMATVVTFRAVGRVPLRKFGPTIDADFFIHLLVEAGQLKAKVRGFHDSFPAYEVYVAKQRVYAFDPSAAGTTPFGLMPPEDIEVQTKWIEVGVPSFLQ